VGFNGSWWVPAAMAQSSVPPPLRGGLRLYFNPSRQSSENSIRSLVGSASSRIGRTLSPYPAGAGRTIVRLQASCRLTFAVDLVAVARVASAYRREHAEGA